MGLNKGRTNNPNGRPKGSLNKVTKDLRSFLEAFLRGNLDSMNQDIVLLSPKDRIQIILKLAEFVLPKYKNIDETAKFGKYEYEEYIRMKQNESRMNNMSMEELKEKLERLRRINDRH